MCAADLGDVRGKVVLVRRSNGWPRYQIVEGAYRGAAALSVGFTHA